MCDHCFSRHVEGQCRECERGEFVRAGGAVCPLCPGEGGERTMLEAWSVARHVPQHVLQSYLEARDHVTGLRAQREAEEAVGEELEALRGANKGVVGTHCGAISKLLELVCPYPGCSEKWVQSKDGRAAAVCVDCGKDYCGLCFKVCKDMRVANVHLQRCRRSVCTGREGRVLVGACTPQLGVTMRVTGQLVGLVCWHTCLVWRVRRCVHPCWRVRRRS